MADVGKFWECKCLHTGHGNLDVNYKMGETVLGTTAKEKDLGVTISADTKDEWNKLSTDCLTGSNVNVFLKRLTRNSGGRVTRG